MRAGLIAKVYKIDVIQVCDFEISMGFDSRENRHTGRASRALKISIKHRPH